METRTIYEDQILKEMQGLSEQSQKKLAKLIRFFKKEIIESSKDDTEKLKPGRLTSFIGSGKGGFDKSEDADAFIRGERDRWEK